jgi:hypothetical protein
VVRRENQASLSVNVVGSTRARSHVTVVGSCYISQELTRRTMSCRGSRLIVVTLAFRCLKAAFVPFRGRK